MKRGARPGALGRIAVSSAVRKRGLYDRTAERVNYKTASAHRHDKNEWKRRLSDSGRSNLRIEFSVGGLELLQGGFQLLQHRGGFFRRRVPIGLELSCQDIKALL